jgi:hypothetical protein
MLPDTARKDRMISLRLTDKDYRGLQRICKREGVRSLSALARIALNRLVSRHDKQSADSSARQRLEQVERRVEHLETIVRTARTQRRGR